MLVVGLTGGIGSGKSTVATLFAERGAPVIDADIITRELTQPGQHAYDAILQHFSPLILQADSTLNRKRLRDIVFADPRERRWLENLLHPLVRDEIVKQLKTYRTPYCIVVIPLLLEAETPMSFIDRILVVDTAPHLQVERSMARDNVQEAQIQSIIQTQIPRQDRLQRAHDVIRNDDDVKELIPQVDELDEKYRQLG